MSVLDLSTLAFKVETGQLEAAKKHLDAVADAVKNLAAANKAAEATNKTSTKAEEQSTDAAVKSAQATKAQADAEKALADAKKATADAAKAELSLKKAQTAASNAGTEATKQSISVLERQTAITDLMAKGLSKGQASVVANIYAFEGLSQSVKDTITQMQIQRGLMGGDPFDKSQSGLVSLKNAHRELSEAIKQYNRDTGLTKEQTRDLVRDKQRLVISMGAEGKSLSDMKAAMRSLQQTYVEQANSNNKLAVQEKEKARLQRESANAVRAVANEEERMRSVVTQLTNAENNHVSTTEKAAIAQANYARNLKRSGIEGEEAAKRLKVFEGQQKVIDAVEQKRQAQYLQRGLQPQIGDVAVSLAAGQNPLTVLLQQGDQIRGLIAQTGVSGELLRKTMANAMTETVKSIGQTAAAMGSVLGGAIASTGKAMLTVAGAPVTALMGGFRTTGVAADVAAANIERLTAAVGLLSKIGIVALIAAVATALYQMYQSVKQHDDLVKSITLTGGALGMTASAAADYAEQLAGVNGEGSKYLTVIAAMAKEGGFVRSEIALVSEAALDLKKYADIAIEDTVKSFRKLKDDPVKAMIELAKATGEIEPQVILAVKALVDMGDKAGAVKLAMSTMAETNKLSVTAMKEDLSGLALFFIKAREGYDSFMAASFKFLFKNDTAKEVAGKALMELRQQISNKEEYLSPNNFRATTEGKKSAKDQLDILRKREQVLTKEYAVLDVEGRANSEKKALNAQLATNVEENLKASKATKDADGSGTRKSNAQTALQKATNRYEDIINKEQDYSTSFNDDMKALLLKKNTIGDLGITQEEYNDAVNKLLSLQPFVTKQLAEEKAYTEGLNKANEERAKNMQKIAEYNNATRDENLRLDYRLEVLGKTEEQVKALNRERDKELKLAKARDDYDKQILANKQVSTRPNAENAAALKAYEDKVKAINRESAVQLVEEYNAAFKEVTDFMRDVLATAIFEGGEAGTKKLRDKVQDIFRKKITLEIDAVVNAFIADVIGLNGKGEASGASGSLGERFDKFADKLTSKDSVFTKQGFENTLTGKIDKAGDFFTKLGDTSETLGDFGKYLKTNSKDLGKYAAQAGDALSYLNSAKLASEGKWGEGIGQAVGTYFGGPVVGEIFRGVGEWVDKLFSGGNYVASTGDSQRNYSASGVVTSAAKMQGVFTNSASADTIVDNLQKQYASAAKTLGITALASQFNYGSNNSDGGKFSLGGGTAGSSFFQQETKLTDEALKLASERAVFAALKGSELPTYLKGVFDDVVTATASSQEINAALEYAQALKQINTQIQAVSLVGLKNLDFKQLDALVSKSGGASNLASNLSSYYENFLTEEEKKASTLESIKQVLDKAGGTFSVAELAKLDRVAFKNLLNTISPDSDLYAALLSVNGAIAGITSPLEDAGAAFKDLGKTIEEEVMRIRNDILGTSPEAQANAQMAFTVATAQARAGDTEAAKNLPALSQALLEFAANNATSLVELNQIRSATAASLSDTAAIVRSFGIVPATASVSANTNAVSVPNAVVPSTVTTSGSSNTEVLVALEAVASQTNKTKDLLDRVINGEETIRVTVIA